MLNPISPLNTTESAPEEQGFELWEVISFAWRQWKFIASIVGATLLVGAIWVLKETPKYTASADILLEPRKDRAPGELVSSDVNIDYATVESQMAIIRSSVFLRRVVEKERLYSDPEFGSVRATGSSLFGEIQSM